MEQKILEFTSEVSEYFESHDCPLTDKFSLLKFAESVFSIVNDEAIDDCTTLLCNLEDPSVMQFIAEGDYSTFDMWDSSQFNNSYREIAIIKKIFKKSW